MRLELATPWSRVKHSTAESLRFSNPAVKYININVENCADHDKMASSMSVDLNLYSFQKQEYMCIIELLAHCKGGSFNNIHIWAWFGYFVC